MSFYLSKDQKISEKLLFLYLIYLIVHLFLILTFNAREPSLFTVQKINNYNMSEASRTIRNVLSREAIKTKLKS
jgi:hypothetical protein